MQTQYWTSINKTQWCEVIYVRLWDLYAFVNLPTQRNIIALGRGSMPAWYFRYFGFESDIQLLFTVKYLIPVYRLGLKIISEEQVSIIIVIITRISHFLIGNNPFFLLNLNFIFNKNWILSDTFWCEFLDTIIRIYKIAKLWK